MKHIFRNTIVSVAVISVGAFAIGYFINTDIPRAFFDARIQAAGAANNVATLINNSLENLHRIEVFEQNGSYDQALDMISYEIGQKQEKQNAAVFLASSLEQMANAAMDIGSNGARTLAVDAVASGVTMVSRLVSYNNSLDQLFTAIQSKILSGPNQPTNIRSLLAAINSDGRAINELSEDFNVSLQKFDEKYGTKPKTD